MSTKLPAIGELSKLADSFETSDRGTTALGVYVQDQTTEVLQVPFLTLRGSFSIAVDTVVDSYSFTAAPAHGIVPGEIIELANGVAFMQALVLTVVGDIITLDTPINHVYTVAAITGTRSSNNMLVDGSATPVIFNIKPGPGQSGDITEIAFDVRAIADMDFTTFGGRAALPRGMILRVKRATGEYRNIYNFKDNGDLINFSHDHNFLLPKGGNTTQGFAAFGEIAGQGNRGVSIRVDGDLGEELQLIVQDDLTLVNLRLKASASGHELQYNK